MSDTGSTETTVSSQVTAAEVLAQADGAQSVEVPKEELKATPEVDAPKIEETKEEPKAEQVQSEEDRKFAAKFAAMSRREKALRQREKAVEARLAELEAKAKTPEIKTEDKGPIEYRLKKDPFGTLKELGLDYETLTRMALNDGKMTPELQMQVMREELKRELDEKYGKELEGIKKSQQEKAEQEKKNREEAQLQTYKTNISDFVKTNKDTYELVAAEGDDATDLIYSTILEHYNTTLEANGEEGAEVLDVKEAADLVEGYLLEEAKKRINVSKIRKLMEPTKTEVSREEPKPVGKKVSPTLSNEQSQEQGPKKQFLSDDESKAEAAKLIRWVE